MSGELVRQNHLVSRKPPVPEQLLISPRRALRYFPPETATADALGIAEADDRFKYYLKSDAAGKRIRASEWICSHLAELVHLAAPACAVIELQNKQRVFGSRRVAGAGSVIDARDYLMTPSEARDNKIGIKGLGLALSSIYAFDMFIYNVDRHAGNYLSVPDGEIIRLYAFDFSRALFYNWPLIGFPCPDTTTRETFTYLRNVHGFYLEEAENTLDKLGIIDTRLIEDIIRRMPEEWLGPDILPPILEWWSSSRREERIMSLREGLRDGSLV
ncbi:HipA family kinase [Gluconobacter japonicus]|uniref:HipA family kinase n=1 Tax=Gluconobacter japonicus TaxID=376620 RepID=UPI001B8BF96C|nr:HipA family kinase [Gluconobacter japonicus]MBS1050514.1 hypothetical protein [Gluconobacter japonicus]